MRSSVTGRHARDEAAVFEDIVDESERLFGEDAPALATTLLACPDVEAWRDDFAAFDRFVTTAEATLREGPMGLSLVAFHPSFARWRQLPQEALASLDEDAMSGGAGGAGGASGGGGDGSYEVWAHFEEAYSDTPWVRVRVRVITLTLTLALTLTLTRCGHTSRRPTPTHRMGQGGPLTRARSSTAG